MPDIDEDLIDPEVRKAILPQPYADQGTDPNEVKRQAAVALEQKHQTGVPGIAGPNMAAMQPPATLPAVQVPEPQPNAQPAPPAIGGPGLASTPIGPPGVSPQMAHDQARQADLNKGSGIDQFSAHHHIAGPILRALDIAGSVFAPNLARFIPGTTLHHNMLEGQNQNALKQDVAQHKEQADIAHTNAETKALDNPKPQKAENPEADAYAVLSDPNSTPEQRKAATDALNTVKGAGKDGKEVANAQAGYGQAISEALKAGRDPSTDPHVQAWKSAIEAIQKDPAENDKTKDIADYLQSKNLPDTPANREAARDAIAKRQPGATVSVQQPAKDAARNSAESAQVEREARNNIRKAEGEYRNTQKSVGQLSTAIDQAKDANGLLTSFVPTMEVLGINAANGVHRISPAEAQAAQLPGGWSEQFNAWFDKASGGKLTPQLVQEGKALAHILTKSAYQRYKSTYEDENNIASGYGVQDFGKRVPLIPGEEAQGGQPTHIVKDANGKRIGTVVNNEYVPDNK